MGRRSRHGMALSHASIGSSTVIFVILFAPAFGFHLPGRSIGIFDTSKMFSRMNVVNFPRPPKENNLQYRSHTDVVIPDTFHDSCSVDMGSGNNGKGPRDGRGWFGRWNGDGKNDRFRYAQWAFVPAAWADTAKPRTSNRTVIESETGLAFPLSIPHVGDKNKFLRFLGGKILLWTLL